MTKSSSPKPQDRRLFLRGLIGSVICAPAIVRASSLMPIKALEREWPGLETWWQSYATYIPPGDYDFEGTIYRLSIPIADLRAVYP